MRSLVLPLLAVGLANSAVACDVPARPDGAPTDAATSDAAVTWPDADLSGIVPIAVEGRTPAGKLSAYHWADIRYGIAWCGDEYELILSETLDNGPYSTSPRFQAWFPLGYGQIEPFIGTLPADISVTRWDSHRGHVSLGNTSEAVFIASHIDEPYSDGARVIGRLVTSAEGWDIDIELDLPLRYVYSCE